MLYKILQSNAKNSPTNKRKKTTKKYQTNEDDFGHGIGQATLKYGIKDYTI